MKTISTFKDVCTFIKKDEPGLVDDVDKVLGFVLILAPIVALGASSPAVLPLLALLGVKKELTDIGKTLLKKLTVKKDTDFLARQRRMEAAYILICYTSFFEAVDSLFPHVRKFLKLKSSEKLVFHKEFLRQVPKDPTKILKAGISEIESFDSLEIPFPHPVESFDEHVSQIEEIYSKLAIGVKALFKQLELWKSISSETKKKITKKLDQIPKTSKKFFRAQYICLAMKYEEFYIWSNLHEHRQTRGQISAFLKQHIELSKATKQSLDIGLEKFGKAIQSIPSLMAQRRASKIVDSLEKRYKSIAELPVIEELHSEEVQKQKELKSPRNSEAFVPQAFKVIHYTGDERLEDEKTWQILGKPREDLGAFLYSCISSPYNKDTPVIILGHPGSGKSLLTKILSVRLFSHRYTPIRVKLRDITAENDIVNQIEEQVRRDTKDTNASWSDLHESIKDRPALVILDGYDELLQASGRAYANYLKKVANFQKDSAIICGSPVHAIVTSRITLIDKADIEPGTTIIRLEAFDKTRISKWISVWNKTNQKYFTSRSVSKFSLPKGKSKNEKKILELAEQPLLLLMLALYDSIDNGLSKLKSLDRTMLYYNLLERFVERERRKNAALLDSGKKEIIKGVNEDMIRLGIVAIGMFNRRTLHIRKSQLDADIKFLQRERSIQISNGRPLTEAELVLGSFFFIHESKAEHKGDKPQERDVDSAFEFMHNTFGEFLTAHFVLKTVVEQTENLYLYRQNEGLRAELLRKLENPDGFPEEWFSCFMYAPLYARPVILEMVREWCKHKLKSIQMPQQDFLDDLDVIVNNQIKRILAGNNLPSIMTGLNKTSFPDYPLLGHMAIYSLNLILLRSVVSDKQYVFDEGGFGTHEDGSRPWDQLTYLWRSWFSLESLKGLSAILDARRDGTRIIIKTKRSFVTPSDENRLNLILNVGHTLADDVTTGLAGLIAYNPYTDSTVGLDTIQASLASEDIDLGPKIPFLRLQKDLASVRDFRHGSDILERFLSKFVSSDTMHWFTKSPESLLQLLKLTRY